MLFIRCKVNFFYHIKRKNCTTVPPDFCEKLKKFKFETLDNSVKSPKSTQKSLKSQKSVFNTFFVVFVAFAQCKIIVFQKVCFRVSRDMFNRAFCVVLLTFDGVSQVWFSVFHKNIIYVNTCVQCKNNKYFMFFWCFFYVSMFQSVYTHFWGHLLDVKGLPK